MRVSLGIRAPGGVLRPWADLSLGQASGYLRAGIALEGPVRFDLAAESRDGGASTSAHGLSLRIGTTL